MVLLPSKPERRILRHLRNRWGVAKSGQVSRQGVVEEWEHWDGSVDAVVRPEAFRIRISTRIADPAPLIAALEQAVRAHEQTLRTGTPADQARTGRMLTEAKQALMGGR